VFEIDLIVDVLLGSPHQPPTDDHAIAFAVGLVDQWSSQNLISSVR
jgi:hypothetical protein